MTKTILSLTFACAGYLFAGGFYLQLGNPDANPTAKKMGAVVTVKATGCHNPEKAVMTATATGFVKGQRRTIPVEVKPIGNNTGDFAIVKQWPDEGKWVLRINGENAGMFTHVLVAATGDTIDRHNAKYNLKDFADSDLEAMLR